MNRALVPALSPLMLAPLMLALAATPAAADPRLVQVMYDEARVVRIDGRTTVQATIMFGDDEVIENVAIGDSQTWQVTPNKRANILFVKPLAPRATTNMTVVTSKRTYLFDLVASPNARPLYVLRFDYPPEPESEKTAADMQLAQGPNAVEQAASTDPYAVVDPAALNFAWTAKGEAGLLPAQTFDDGNATYLTWPAGRDVPAILTTNHDGVEGPVNFTVRGDTIVIDGVPRQIVLRSGKESAILTNSGPERAAKSARGTMPAFASAREIN